MHAGQPAPSPLLHVGRGWLCQWATTLAAIRPWFGPQGKVKPPESLGVSCSQSQNQSNSWPHMTLMHKTTLTRLPGSRARAPGAAFRVNSPPLPLSLRPPAAALAHAPYPADCQLSAIVSPIWRMSSHREMGGERCPDAQSLFPTTQPPRSHGAVTLLECSPRHIFQVIPV